MVEHAKRTIAFFCPSCRQAVILERNAFQLAASSNQLQCPCGHSVLNVEMLGDRIHLRVPCLFCEKEHSVTCSTHSFLHEKTLAFSCSVSGMDCCYVGEEGPVYAAMRRLEETVDKLEAEAGAAGTFLNDLIMEEVLAEIRDIGQRGGICCSCGSKEWTLQVNFSSVELCCHHCKAALKIPAATIQDLEDLCCKTHLIIHGKEIP